MGYGAGRLTERIWRWLGSVRITVPLLILMAGGAVIGTVVPQGVSEEELVRAAGPRLAFWIETLGLSDLYHAPPFELLLLALAANIVVCTLERIPHIYRNAAREPGRFEEGWAKLLPFFRTLPVAGSLSDAELQARVEGVARTQGRLRRAPVESGWALRVRRGGFARFAPYSVHLGILLILAGALVGGLVGFRGEMKIPEGAGTRTAERLRTGEKVQLPFEVLCDRFTVEYYRGTDNPSRYASLLRILQGNAVRVTREIEVNHPLRYRGYTFYQSSYGFSDPRWFDLEVSTRDGTRVERVAAGQPVPVDGSGRSVALVDFAPDYRGMGPAALIEEDKEGRTTRRFPVFQRYPDLHGDSAGSVRVRLRDFDRRAYTGLMVTRDPGTNVVWAGSILLVIGLCVGFFWPRRELWVGLSRDDRGRRRLVVAARLLAEGDVGPSAERFVERLRSQLGGA